MKQLKGFVFFILTTSYLFYSCTGNSAAGVSNDNSASSPGNSSAKSTGDASFSCKIDGKDFSGKGNDSYSNVAIVTSPGLMNFVLVPMEKQQGVPPQFNFFVADHGATTIHASNNGDYAVKYSPGGIDSDYKCDEITVNIASSVGSRVKGTFSGTLIDPKTSKEVAVTEGKFDIPYSPYSKK
jgi:hypothetical protein